MDSTGRFLLGGALGAALGYLLSQKSLEKTEQTDQVAAPVVAPAVSAPAVPPLLVPEQRLPSVPSPTLSAPPSAWSPVPTAEPPVATSVPPLAPALPTAPSYAPEVPPVQAPVESEVIVTRDFLEEPLPGSGWHSTAPLLVGDENFDTTVHDSPVIEFSRFGEELPSPSVIAEPAPRFAPPLEHPSMESTLELPVMEHVVEVPVVEQFVALPVVEEAILEAMGPGTAGSEALAQAADVMGRLPVAESPPVEDTSRVDDLKSRIEETRRRIRHELEQPFETPAPARPLERDWMTAAVVPSVEPVSLREPIVAESVVVEPTFEAPVTMEALPMETVTVETLPMEAVETESVFTEQELSAPVTMETVVAAPVFAEPTPAEPAALEPLAVEAVTAEVPPVVELEVDTPETDSDLEVESGPEEPVDYDSMKNRIESTRSRLKAKAFDAMMTGESALLGRDVEGSLPAHGKVAGVDSEVDETIETSLREEEE